MFVSPTLMPSVSERGIGTTSDAIPSTIRSRPAYRSVFMSCPRCAEWGRALTVYCQHSGPASCSPLLKRPLAQNNRLVETRLAASPMVAALPTATKERLAAHVSAVGLSRKKNNSIVQNYIEQRAVDLQTAI